MERIEIKNGPAGSFEWLTTDFLSARLAVFDAPTKQAILDDIGRDIERYLNLIMAAYLSNNPGGAMKAVRGGILVGANRMKKFLP
jgi:hypothetical protein